MKRLVYAPKVWAYVKTMNNGVINLSDYLVRGNVTRMIDQVSTFELQVRNPDMIWTKSARHGRPVFRPMDPVTIWMQRVAGHPVQVMTGYLDRTPYLQLYPGVCTIAGSCTLKRLLHIYWDMALPYTHTWLQGYGWTGDHSTGMLLNTAAAKRALSKDRGEVTSDLNDGSIGNLLYATLTDIADWPKDQIHIERLPKGVIEKVKTIYAAFAEDSASIHSNLEYMLSQYIGEGAVPSDGGEESTGAEGSVPPLPASGNYSICQLKQIASTQKFKDVNEAAAIMYAESKGDPKVFNGTCCWGLWQIHQGNNGFSREMATDPARSTKTAHTMSAGGTDWGQWQAYGNSDFQFALKKAKACRLAPIEREDNQDLRNPDQRATGGKLKTNSDSGLDGGEVAPPVKPSDVTADSNGYAPPGHDGIDLITNGAKPVYAVVKSKVIDVRAGGWWTKGAHGDISKGDGVIRIKSLVDVGDVKKGMIFGYGHCEKARVKEGETVEAGALLGYTGMANAWHIHWFVGDPGTDARDGTRNPEPFWEAFKKGKAPLGSDPGGGGSEDSVPFEDIMSTAKAAAFSQSLGFPSLAELTEAVTLTGPRSLMNDKPIFPFIQEMSAAALRSFQSLPNGAFYAFFPDYFGHIGNRKPYWMIDDIEILNGDIKLTDEALATHVFAVGDTIPFTPGVDHFERMTSSGVTNIYNIGQTGFLTFDKNSQRDAESQAAADKQHKSIVSDPEGVIKFLKKYGARPHVEEAPQVRSKFYEAFLGWHTYNLMWSRQFLTEFEVTFMPELFPGGLVGFEAHGVQCYIDQVVHEFDYEEGFTTTAQLSAPASLSSSKNTTDPLQFGLVRAG